MSCITAWQPPRRRGPPGAARGAFSTGSRSEGGTEGDGEGGRGDVDDDSATSGRRRAAGGGGHGNGGGGGMVGRRAPGRPGVNGAWMGERRYGVAASNRLAAVRTEHTQVATSMSDDGGGGGGGVSESGYGSAGSRGDSRWAGAAAHRAARAERAAERQRGRLRPCAVASRGGDSSSSGDDLAADNTTSARDRRPPGAAATAADDQDARRAREVQRVRDAWQDKALRFAARRALRGFASDPARRELALPEALTASDRYHLHLVAEEFGLGHESRGEGARRAMVVWKTDGEAAADERAGRGAAGRGRGDAGASGSGGGAAAEAEE
jgi:hypothetical protein